MEHPVSCPGSGYISSPMTQSVLCYCGQIFRRRFKSLKRWAVPEHKPQASQDQKDKKWTNQQTQLIDLSPK